MKTVLSAIQALITSPKGIASPYSRFICSSFRKMLNGIMTAAIVNVEMAKRANSGPTIPTQSNTNRERTNNTHRKESEILKALAHPVRLRMVEGLMHNECNVKRIVKEIAENG